LGRRGFSGDTWPRERIARWTHKLWGWVKPRRSTGRCIWLHAVSVGEVNLLAPILDRLLKDQPDLEIVISTTTETGFDLARQRFADHYVFFCPLDFTWAIRRVFETPAS
jgi:3-deoxy-D-manno-octulosonic-acid transferase